ncbi:MAG TPA: hypothetical protein VGI40_18770 [Pirellulaceae bacterium]|jgi:hypothetical protein
MSIKDSEPDKELQEVCELLAKGNRVGPDLRKKLDEQARQIREDIRKKHGTLNIATELVREARECA